MIISNKHSGNGLIDKLEQEGLEYAILGYFGRELDSNHPKLNELWAQAYDTLTEIVSILDNVDRPE